LRQKFASLRSPGFKGGAGYPPRAAAHDAQDRDSNWLRVGRAGGFC